MPYESNRLTCSFCCREMIMFAGSCWDLINSSFQDCSHLCAVDSQDEVHGASFSCVDCSFWVLHVSDTCGCTIDGHPVVLSFGRDKTVKVTVLAPNYGCHICSLDNFVGWTCQNFLWGKQMLAAIISLRPLSNFTQMSFESKWEFVVAKDSDICQFCVVHFCVHQMSKECKHTTNLTQIGVAFGLV